MNSPDDYKALEAWGKLLGSYDSYIKNEQRKASRDGAPLDAIYQKRVGTELTWVCLSECASRTQGEVRDVMERLAEVRKEKG